MKLGCFRGSCFRQAMMTNDKIGAVFGLNHCFLAPMYGCSLGSVPEGQVSRWKTGNASGPRPRVHGFTRSRLRTVRPPHSAKHDRKMNEWVNRGGNLPALYIMHSARCDCTRGRDDRRGIPTLNPRNALGPMLGGLTCSSPAPGLPIFSIVVPSHVSTSSVYAYMRNRLGCSNPQCARFAAVNTGPAAAGTAWSQS